VGTEKSRPQVTYRVFRFDLCRAMVYQVGNFMRLERVAVVSEGEGSICYR